MFVRVALNIPAFRTFTYAVPDALSGSVSVGSRVLVPVGRRRQTGYVVACLAAPDAEAGTAAIKPLLEIPDADPWFDESDIAFYTWMCDYYQYPLGKALAEMIPAASVKSRRWIALTPEGRQAEAEGLSPEERQIVSALAAARGLSWTALQARCDGRDLTRSLAHLEARGWVSVGERLSAGLCQGMENTLRPASGAANAEGLTPLQARAMAVLSRTGEMTAGDLMAECGVGRSVLSALRKKGLVVEAQREVRRSVAPVSPLGEATPLPVLTGPQGAAREKILAALKSRRFSPCLLHGVTGSGKTEVYLQAIRQVLDEGGSCLYLVPEIGLTPQLLGRLSERFPTEPLAVLHSGVSPAVRHDTWRRLQRGEIRLVVGARSALFAPMRDLRLLVVDEEHDESYKQDDRIRYHARDLSIVRAQQCRAVVVLGSATPSVPTFHAASTGRYAYLSLPDRVENRTLPQVDVVDMRREKGSAGETPILSRHLLDGVADTLARRKQALLLLNRRGFHTILLCRDCGSLLKCPNCDLSLTSHAREGMVKCHTCDYAAPLPSACPACADGRIASYGVGTERVEALLRLSFPQARIARMDRDTIGTPDAHERILRAVADRQIDILVGTQMISKGHDFPEVILVGVVSADVALGLPDFRAAERTFQLLMQAAGRGGRGDTPGRVVLQTFNPGHYAVQRAQAHDYDGFYREEIALRQATGYPPFCRMVHVVIQGNVREAVIDGAGRFAAAAEAGKGPVQVIGPAESPLAKVRGKHRWHVLLKGANSRQVRELARYASSQVQMPGIDIRIDVDPVNFM